MDRTILEAVARADLILCAAARVAAVAAALFVILLAMVLVGRKIADPCRVNYYAPGADITTEGPDEMTDEYHGWEAEGHDVG